MRMLRSTHNNIFVRNFVPHTINIHAYNIIYGYMHVSEEISVVRIVILLPLFQYHSGLQIFFRCYRIASVFTSLLNDL